MVQASPARETPSGRAAAVRRIVALAPSAAEIVFALGAADRVVGVSDFARDLPESRGKVLVGGFSPDLERIVALAPDLVIASRDGTDRAAFEKIQSLNLRTALTSGASLDGVLADIERVGEAIGEVSEASRLTRRLHERIQAASRVALRRGRRFTALALIWPEPPVLAGPATFVGDVLSKAGLRNVAGTKGGEWPRVSFETLASLSPDVLVRPETRENQEAFRVLTTDPRWNVLGAIRKGRVVTLPGDTLERPGPRLVDALELLVTSLEKLPE